MIYRIFGTSNPLEARSVVTRKLLLPLRRGVFAQPRCPSSFSHDGSASRHHLRLARNPLMMGFTICGCVNGAI